MPRVPRKKRFKHKKDHDRRAAKRAAKEKKRQDNDSSVSESARSLISPGPISSASDTPARHYDDYEMHISESENDLQAPSCSSETSQILSPPGYESKSDFKVPSSSDVDGSSIIFQKEDMSSFIIPETTLAHSSSSCSWDASVGDTPQIQSLLKEVKSKVEIFLPGNCVCVTQGDYVKVLLLSSSEDTVTQRQLNFSVDGKVSLKVHCTPYSVDTILKNALPKKYLNSSSVGYFVDRMVQVINFVRQFEICVGASNSEYQDVWAICDHGQVDRNPYKESRYSETFRSSKCHMLVNPRKRRCVECSNVTRVLHRKHEMAKKEEPHRNTPNVSLTEQQKLRKLQQQRRMLDITNRKLERLNIKTAIEKEGVKLDSSISDDFKGVLASLNIDKLIEEKKITHQQALFLEQQLTALNAKSPRGRRWHPTMIRFALSIYHKSPSAYGAMYESGMLTLPCRRTLFDYTHFKPVQDGVHYEVLEAITKKLDGFKLYQRYHTLICDEMYISKNLVYEKSTGRIIGYVTLDDVQKELDALDAYLNDSHPNNKRPSVASKILTFLIKGVSSSVKEAIATYAVDTLTKEQLYRWSWEVIGKCERAGIAVIAFVSDGSPINRAFIKMNKPYTTKCNVIFDTINKAAPNDTLNKFENKVRMLFFIADVPHLLKTIRNCFLSSSNKRYFNKNTGKMMLRRRMEKNGMKILWATIVRLYHHQKDSALRLSYKLNSQNVFLNGYSKMRVKYAAEVLSDTVAQHLETLKWENTAETIIFIRKVNAFFDMLNGAHSQQGARKRNPNLEPYCCVTDARFEELEKFLLYLKEWEDDAAAAGNKSINDSIHDVDDPHDLGGEQWEDNEEDEGQDPAGVRQLSYQTVEGIKITIHGFTGAVKFLLHEGVKFINARVFCQDSIEQYFSKQRSRGGGSTNPNFSQTLHNQRSIHVQGNLGMKRNYRGNTEVETQCMTISEELLPKKGRVQKPVE